MKITAQTEEQLLQELKLQKNKTSQLQIRLRLLELIYERDRNEWQKEVLLLVNQRAAYSGTENQALISLVEAERASFQGNRGQLIKIFDEKLMPIHFKETAFEWRKKMLGAAIYPNSEKFHYKKLLNQLTTKQNKREQTALYLQIARNFAQNFQKDSAIWASNLALQLAKRSDKKWVLIEAMQQQAEVFWQFNLYESAVQRSIFSVQLAEEAQLDYFRVRPLLLIASILIDLKNVDQAFPYLKRAYEFAKISNDNQQLAYANYLYSKYYLAKNQYKRANARALLAHDFFNQVGNIRYAHRANLLILSTKSDQFNISTAYQSMIAQVKPSQEALFKAELYFDYGQYLLNTAAYLQAEQALLMSLQSLPSEAFIRPKIASAYGSLALIANRMNQPAKAYDYQQKYTNWLENSVLWRSAARIEEMAAANLREERERLIVNQQASIERAQKERKIVELQRDRQLFISIIFIVAVIFGVIIYVLRMQQAKIKQEQREAELSQTLLRTQMNPHFVFNAMSVIQSYIYENDPEKSSQFLVNFSRLMRLILENSPKEFIPIELEREILDKYLSAQKMRFENRFDYELTICDELLFNKALVSPMITQPFIENAIEHGQLHTVNGGKIAVDFSINSDQLLIQIKDNGVGRKKSAATKKVRTHKSMAIDITRERIAILNKKHKFNGSLQIHDLDTKKQTGTLVTLVLPLKYDCES